MSVVETSYNIYKYSKIPLIWLIGDRTDAELLNILDYQAEPILI